MQDIKTGSLELEDQSVDLADLDDAYEEDLDKEQNQTGQPGQDALAPGLPQPGALGAPPGQGSGVGGLGAPGL